MDEIRKAVRETYGKIGATGGAETGCCTTNETSCCAPEPVSASAQGVSKKLGYSEEEVTSVPEGANLGLGCGNPQAIANLKPGETVLDLGSGGGFDCFLASKQVGEDGRVIGVDMTAEMITRARENAAKVGATNVEFRLGEIEHLPVADGEVDAILSNCVINLSPDKLAVHREAFRALRAGGRLAILDVVSTAPLPDEVRNNLELHTRCIAGAATIPEVEAMLAEAGFSQIHVNPIGKSSDIIREWMPGSRIEDYIVSATIEAVKP